MVGVAGFEPATSCSQSKCSTKLSYTPNDLWAREESNPRSLRHLIYSQVGLANSHNSPMIGAGNRNRTGIFWMEAKCSTVELCPRKLVEPVRFELTTACVQGRCSPTELRPHGTPARNRTLINGFGDRRSSRLSYRDTGCGEPHDRSEHRSTHRGTHFLPAGIVPTDMTGLNC